MIRQELRLVGSGGQGVILATVILAEAAVLSGMHTAQSQSYGPEARGGSCKAETLISSEEIGFTKVQNPTFLMALTQQSFDKYAVKVSDQCLILADSSIDVSAVKSEHIICLPIIETARNVVGRIQTANIVAVGCINELLGLTTREIIKESVMMHIPAGTSELNMKALDEGFNLVKLHNTQSEKKKIGASK